MPQLSLAGLEAAKRRLFSQQAPVPIETIVSLRPREGTFAKEMMPTYYREVAFKVGTNRLAIRQEWVVVLSTEGKRPLIMSVSASRASPRKEM